MDSVTLPGYALSDLLCEDARTSLYRGVRVRDGRPVLVRTHTGPEADPGIELAFREELDIGQRIPGPGIARSIALERAGARIALVQEDFGADLLARAIPAAGMEVPRAVAIAVQVARALTALHERGIVHRSVTPWNILLSADGASAKLAGVGRAAATDGLRLNQAAGDRRAETLAYLAPEQTGRMEHPVDHRADLYSLGATLFELLAGRPPFLARDPLELVHSHIARLPPPIDMLRPGVPRALARIVAKLLAKAPADRYQSAAGVLADLEQWQAEMHRGDAGEQLPDRFESPAALRIPPGLYGRDRELRALQAALRRARQGIELVTVSGFAGVGKSSLVEQLRQPALAEGGYFATGKFDQLGGDGAYSAMRQALHALLARLRDEPGDRLIACRNRLLAELEGQGRVLIDFLPELEAILGPQPPVEELPPLALQKRFSGAIAGFVRALASLGSPVVLALDDIQWADTGSLDLLHAICTAPRMSNVLVVVVYRDNEVHERHAAIAAIEKIRAANVPIESIVVPPLDSSALSRLVADALDAAPEAVAPLVAVARRKTDGIPFVVNAFLHALVDRGLLVRTPAGWSWQLDAIDRDPSLDTAAGVLSSRLARLPDTTQSLLADAACLGPSFSVETLAHVAGVTAAEARRWLHPAAVAGLVIPSGNEYRFLHDRVQEVAYEQRSERERERAHLAIGQQLQARAGAAPTPDQLASIVKHLNLGRRLLDSDAARLWLARLDLEAARHARKATAYGSAAALAAIGIELLPDRAWEEEYELAFGLYTVAAESAYLSGDAELAEALYPVAAERARCDLDRIHVYLIEVGQYELQGRYHDAIRILKTGLALLGVVFPDGEEALRRALRDELDQIPVNLAGRRIADLPSAPPMADPRRVATVRLLMRMWTPCYLAGLPTLVAVISVRLANLSLQHGHCDITPMAYLTYSFVAGFLTGDYAAAFEFGQAGLELAKRYPDSSVRGECYLLFGCGTNVWRRPLRTSVPYLEQAYQLAQRTGDLAYASYAAHYIVYDAFAQGQPIPRVQALYREHAPFMRRTHGQILDATDAALQSMRELAGLEPFDEAAYLAAYESASGPFRALYFAGKLQAAYLLNAGPAVQWADEALALAPVYLAGTLKVAEVRYHAALIYLAAFEQATPADRPALWARAEQQRAELAHLSRFAPENFRHKQLIVEAEMARLGGDPDGAIQLYDAAIAASAREGFVQDEALARELAARCFLQQGNARAASAYLADAYRGYERWGAARKVAQLASRYPELAAIQPLSRGEPRPEPPEDTGALDLISLSKISQAISGEMDADRLLSSLMRISLENAGARRGCLVLLEGAEMRVVATATADGACVEFGRPASAATLPFDLVRYVVRTGASFVLNDVARDGRFARDPYIARVRPCSIACIPVRHKDAVIGVLYLENELTARVFSARRLLMLELLAGQAAISLENARLYAQTERRGRIARSLADTARLLSQTLDPRCVAEVIVGRVHGMLDCEWAGLWQIARDAGDIEGLALAGTLPEGDADRVRSLVSRAAAERRRLGTPAGAGGNNGDGADAADAGEAAAPELVAMPLVLRDTALGVLAIGAGRGRAFQASDLRVAQAFVDHGAIALHNARLFHEQEHLIAAMQRHASELRALSAHLVSAREEERQRIAREVHDELGQALAAVKFDLASLLRSLPAASPDVKRHADSLMNLVDSTIQSMRRIITELRPPMLDELGLPDAIEWFVQEFESRSGIRCRLSTRVGTCEVAPDRALALFRILQEALTNVAKHAGATEVAVTLSRRGRHIVLQVRDNGRGIEAEAKRGKGLGILGMRERAISMGGVLSIAPARPRGTVLTASIPTDEPAR